MECESRRQRLIDALKHLTPEMKETLRQRKEEGLEQKDRPDFVWHSLLQSFATMGNARGWDGLIGNEENYNKVTFEALSALDRVERLENLDEVLRASKVRMPAKKAVWLDLDYEMIIEMGGPEAARRQALAQDGREGKVAFMQRFHGIGDKYARNIWMDVYHPDFRDAIAVDERIKRVTEALGYSFKNYPEHERFYQEIAREANLEGWEVDRLLYNHRGEFLAIIGAGREERAPDPGNSSLSRDGDSTINVSSKEVEKDGLPGKRLAQGWRDLSGAKHPATKSVWSGEESYLVKGATQVPIVQSIPFGYDDIDEWMRVALGEREGHIYSRNTNPTTRAFEEKVRALEAAEASTSFATGMAAISNTLFAFLAPGNRVVSVKDTYGGTNKVFLEFLPRAGVEVKLCDTTDPDAISAELAKGCEVLYLETPTNPTLKLVDIGRLSEAGHEAGAVVVVDGTLATPINQSPLALGADLVLHSASKYLGGHADVLGGVLCGPGELVRRVYHYREINGAALDPFAAYLLIRGLKTLELRVTRHNENAMKVARFLEVHPAVERVFYPGLESHPQHELAKRQMRGFGGMLSFSLVGGYEAVRAFLPRLQFAHRAANLGAVETTVGPPATTSHVESSAQEREAMGIPESLVRYSTGIEHPDDLISDLDNALSATRAGTPNVSG
jgi:cystathionine gamma-synthase